MNLPLFCFGSLMDRDVLACVLGAEVPDRVEYAPATLSGYHKARLPHETYPLLVADPLGIAEGVLIYHLTKAELDRIVFFEGEEYELTPCETRCREQAVNALFFDEGIMPPAETAQWNFADWQATHKSYLIRQSTVYMSYYGKMSAAEADQYWQNYDES